MSGESMRPLEDRGVTWEKKPRHCDDPELNWLRIRRRDLWEKFEEEKRKRRQKELDQILKGKK